MTNSLTSVKDRDLTPRTPRTLDVPITVILKYTLYLLLDKTKNFDVVFALIKPREILKEHLHSRPNSGDEIFLFHKGGKFKVKNGTSIKLFDTKNPILIRFNSLEPYSIINRLDNELTFFAFYSPPFEHNEVKV